MNPIRTWIVFASTLCILPWSTLKADEPGRPEPSDVEIVVDLDTVAGKIYNFWNVYPVTDQAPFLDAKNFGQLKQEYRYAKYINCVRLLGGKDLKKDDYFRGVDEKGQAICDFKQALAMLSGIRKCGFTPWIVLDNVPATMSMNPTKNLYGNTRPPADFDLWSSYVRQFVQALVDKFGIEEVAQWRFRVGTEPDLNPGHWTGTKQEYLKHYDYSVAAVRSVLPRADVGPGNVVPPLKVRRQKSWAPAIINHCGSGTNHVSGQAGTPAGFFGSSYYTTVGKTDRQFDQVIKFLRGNLDRHRQFKNTPIEIQEFGILNEGGKRIVGDGTEFGGSWLAHMADKIYQNRVRRVYQWSWNTNKGGDLPIPLSHVMDKLQQMADETRLPVKVSRTSEAEHLGCIAAKKGDRIDLIVFRHLSVRDNGHKTPVRLILDGDLLATRKWKVSQASLVDGEHAGFISQRNADVKRALAAAGDNAKPRAIASRVAAVHRLKYEQLSRLHSLKPLPEPAIDSAGRMQFELQMDGHAVILLQLE